MRTIKESEELAYEVAMEMHINLDTDRMGDVQLLVMFDLGTTEEEIKEFIERLDDGFLTIERNGMDVMFTEHEETLEEYLNGIKIAD